MCLPTVTSLSEDALRAVPRTLREGAYGLGATRFDVSVRVVVPSALSGVIAAFILAIARAVGETMIVALAAGGLAQMAFGPAPAQPLYAAEVPLDTGAAVVQLDPNENTWLQPLLAPGDDPSSASRDVTASFAIDNDASVMRITLDGSANRDLNDSIQTNANAPPAPFTLDIPLSAFVDADTAEPLDPSGLRDALPPGESSVVTLIYDADDGFFDNVVFRPQASSQTMTAYMVQIFLGDAEFASVEYHSSYAVGATLFLMTLILTMLGNIVLRRYREAYE
jgi:hypothetical protein